LQKERTDLVTQVNQKAQQEGFLIQPSPAGLMTVPVINGKPVPQEEFLNLPEEQQAEIQTRSEKLQTELRSVLRQIQDVESKGAEAVNELNREVALYAIGHLVADLREKYAKVHEITEYIEAVQNDILDNLEQFLGIGVQQQQAEQVPIQLQAMIQQFQEQAFKKYEVNVLVDNSKDDGAPVVIEQNPTYQNLLGKVEREVQFGALTTDFTMIRAGSIHRANGGYLVLLVEDLFRSPLAQYSWEGLKTALKTGEIQIEEPGERAGYIPAKTLKPEPIPLDVKVALIGTPQIYQILYMADPDFKELFKVKAVFDIVMDRNDDNAFKYADFACNLVHEENLKHLTRDALARVIEHGSRLAEDQEKLSTRFSDIADLIREANFYAIQDNSDQITAYIEAVQNDILDNLEQFLGIGLQQQAQAEQVPIQLQAMMQQFQEQAF
ncbi:MAG TPA: ATP-binding protein, partial [Methanomicrobiales archaeon]|nr:ATP-binding protein [Methanomicrobiales archaeon]